MDFSGQAPKLNSLVPLLFPRSFWIMIVLFTVGVTGAMGIYAMLPIFLSFKD
jgi:hypothetical protein